MLSFKESNTSPKSESTCISWTHKKHQLKYQLDPDVWTFSRGVIPFSSCLLPISFLVFSPRKATHATWHDCQWGAVHLSILFLFMQSVTSVTSNSSALVLVWPDCMSSTVVIGHKRDNRSVGAQAHSRRWFLTLWGTFLPAAVRSKDSRMASWGQCKGHILAVGTSHCPESSGDFGGVFDAGTSLWGGARDERMETSAKLTHKDRLRELGLQF